MPHDRRTPSGRLATVAAALVTLLVLAGCSTSDSAKPAATTVPSRALRVLVTNDDGVKAEGLDDLVEALRGLPDTEVTVIAPATNQSGTAGTTTPGPLTVTDTTTLSGFPAKAVAGYPADTIVWAIDQGGMPERPDVVISGVNNGQNVGTLADVSGTVGAARAAVARGIPALASSQGLGDPPAYAAAVSKVLDWVDTYRGDLVSGDADSPVLADNLNVPTCPNGVVRGLVQVPTATDMAGRDVTKVDCASSATDPVDDVAAFVEGFAALSPLGAAPAGG